MSLELELVGGPPETFWFVVSPVFYLFFVSCLFAQHESETQESLRRTDAKRNLYTQARERLI